MNDKFNNDLYSYAATKSYFLMIKNQRASKSFMMIFGSILRLISNVFMHFIGFNSTLFEKSSFLIVFINFTISSTTQPSFGA